MASTGASAEPEGSIGWPGVTPADTTTSSEWPGVALYQQEMYREETPVKEPAALLVIDMQNDFCGPHGALAVQGGRELAGPINEALSDNWTLKIATRDYHPADHVSFATQHPGAQPFTSTHTIANPHNPNETQTTTLWPPHCVQGTDGYELISELDVWKLHYIIDKGMDKRVESYSAFGPPFTNPEVCMTGLEDLLREHDIVEVDIVGLALDYCVKHTALDAARKGFKTTVYMNVSMAVDQSKANLAALWKEMHEAGVLVSVHRPTNWGDELNLLDFWNEIIDMAKALP
ncbi:hypothetical protein LTR36_009822 [Oleoguttula mirabilis]|uniref:nicotinamidase n=1 Tax=Oleoguttula mirabilis TaxID=1507867 RepID=A0AAV9J6R7_9PEZI|nr:hypothetical protein LTR36_009822 [Oleoguttula mirabilis]